VTSSSRTIRRRRPTARYCRPMGGEKPAASRDFPDRGGDLAFILQRERRGSPAPVLEALLELRSGDGQPAVRDASDRLVRHNAPWALDLSTMARELIEAAGPERDQRLFLSWSVNPEPVPFVDLAAREGIRRRVAVRGARKPAGRAERRFRV
jgi:hypothetical protein